MLNTSTHWLDGEFLELDGSIVTGIVIVPVSRDSLD